MPYQASWHIVHQVIEARFWGRVSVEDTDVHNDACVQLLTEAQNMAPKSTVHLLLDALEAESIPPLYLRFAQGMRVLKFKNRGTLFLITRSSSIKSIIEVTAYVSREHFPLRVFAEREEALQALDGYLARDAQRAAAQGHDAAKPANSDL